jgi:hypothetical protein
MSSWIALSKLMLELPLKSKIYEPLKNNFASSIRKK